MEIVPKPPKKVSPLERFLQFFSLFLFFLSFISFIFLFLSTKGLETKKKELENRFSTLETPEIRQMKRELSQLEVQFSEIENILASHSFPSSFFPFLENKILKNVTLNSLQVDIAKKQAKILGTTDNFFNLAKQYSLFKQSPEITSAEITSISISPTGKINFEIAFSFKEKIIK